MLKHFFISLSLLLLAMPGIAQGWERIVTGGAQDGGQAITFTPDGGYAITGYYGFGRVLVAKTNANGLVEWSKNITGAPSIGAGQEILLLPDQHLLVVGWQRGGLGQPARGFLAKLNLFGQLIWTKTVAVTGGENQFTDALLLPNGHIMLTGFVEQANSRDDFWLVEIDANGNQITSQTYGQWDVDEKANGITLLPGGDVVLAGEMVLGIDRDLLLMRIKPNGTQLWATEYGFDFVPNSFSIDRALDVATTADGNLVICGFTNATTTAGSGGLIVKIQADGSPSPIWFSALPGTMLSGVRNAQGGGFLFTGSREISATLEDLYILKTDEAGAQIWSRTIGRGGPDAGENILSTPDGGSLAVGTTTTDISTQDSYAYLVKTDALGRVHTNIIDGYVFQDLNGNCQQGATEPALSDWILRIESPDFTRYVATNDQGYFSVTVDTGEHVVSVVPSNNLWEACQDEYPVNFPVPLDSAQVIIPVRTSIICPSNEIDVQAATLRKCSNNTYFIRYCNKGTIPSPDTRIEVVLDPALNYVSSSITPQAINGDTLRFQVGYLDKGQCESFSLVAFLRCDSVLTGQAHCVTAHIYPDTLCTPAPGWDGSIIRAGARCEDQKAKLSLKNAGKNPTTNPVDFIVIEDLIQMFQLPPVILNPGQDSTVFQAPADGKTYRIIALQSPGYPGESYPTAAVEGCQTDTSTTPVSLGFYTMFPNDDAEPFVATACIESIEANQVLPAFSKSGHPKGYDTDHYIDRETDLHYVIRFSNNGSDTVRTVTVRDTLSPWLDPATVFPGAASHPYEFEVYGNGIVQFVLPNTNLIPGGSAPETRSGGFVSFRVAQKPNVPCETQLLNRAAVTFDYQAPSLTDQVRHTVCLQDSFLLVQTTETFLPQAKVRTYPNPFTEWVLFDVHEVQAKEYSLQLFDTQGRLLSTRVYDHPTFRLFRSQIPAGIIVYRLAADGRPVTAGTLMRVPTP